MPAPTITIFFALARSRSTSPPSGWNCSRPAPQTGHCSGGSLPVWTSPQSPHRHLLTLIRPLRRTGSLYGSNASFGAAPHTGHASGGSAP